MHELLEVVFVAVVCIIFSYLIEEALADIGRWLNGADDREGQPALPRRSGGLDLGNG